ncbi:MAG: ATP-binding cassette domain-containing protein [Rhodobacteraceae bacterium]|nr:ATP-binding cassette domain-containing protein [Paracoccaceae bacterium]PHR54964.1 MAG: ABC transporter ATP-binding protein [Robiginitomaculum sp.]
MTSEVKIKCRNLWKLFGSAPESFMREHDNNPSPETIEKAGYIGAVQDVSFDVHAGEILMIMGLSGSGKSTLIRCITRLNDPTFGSMEYDGDDLLKATPEELIEIRRHKMGMVFQNFGLLPNRDVLSNIAFPLEVRGMPKAEREAKAREMIELVSLTGREAYFPRELSGGQQQRVGIARSLAVEPDVWFLDEPFSALDPLIRAEMQDEFLRLQKKLKKTIVFITHDFEEAVKLGDRIGIMKDGRMVQMDTPEQIVLHPATDYVAEFARNAPHERIVTVRAIMSDTTVTGDNPIDAHALIGAVAKRVLTAEAPIPVEHDGQIIGSIDRTAMLNGLFGDDA